MAPVHAEKADSQKNIHVDADSYTWDAKSGSTLLLGKVKLVQGTLQVLADKASMSEASNGEQRMSADGKPVQFQQKLDSGEMLEARSERVDYDSSSGDVKLSGHAWLKRGADELTGSVIHYNMETEVYRADGGKAGTDGDGRVHIVIQPKKKPPQGQAQP